MNITMYKVRTDKYYISNQSLDDLIKPVEVDKFNEKTVWIDGRANRRETNYETYCETLEEAYSLYQQSIMKEIEFCQKTIDLNTERIQRYLKLANDFLEKTKK